MAAARVCSECGGSLEGKAPQAKTCSVQCRQRRARRRKRVNDEAEQAEQAVREIVVREHDHVVERVLQQELQPVVREAIDEDVIRAIDQMVKLTPAAVEALRLDLQSTDAVLRQRAAALVVKYTVGHPALVKATEDTAQPLQVIFNLPRPGDSTGTENTEGEAIEDVIEEDRVCDLCGEQKSATEFVAGSERCKTCFEDYKARVLAEFAA
jgi:hypothetical protein